MEIPFPAPSSARPQLIHGMREIVIKSGTDVERSEPYWSASTSGGEHLLAFKQASESTWEVRSICIVPALEPLASPRKDCCHSCMHDVYDLGTIVFSAVVCNLPNLGM
jgi:hypothetical protein